MIAVLSNSFYFEEKDECIDPGWPGTCFVAHLRLELEKPLCLSLPGADCSIATVGFVVICLLLVSISKESNVSNPEIWCLMYSCIQKSIVVFCDLTVT